MVVPEFIRELRARVGHQLLWLPGVTAVVSDDRGRVLLTGRRDTGRRALPSGIPEPAEQLASACALEVLEETGVSVRVDQLLSVWTQPPITYPNGDRCQFVNHTFTAHPTSGTAHVAHDESLDVTWRPADAVADLTDEHQEAVTRARAGGPVTWFAH